MGSPIGLRQSNEDLGTIVYDSLEERSNLEPDEKSSKFEAPTFPDLATNSDFTLESRHTKLKKKKGNKIRNIDILIFGGS